MYKDRGAYLLPVEVREARRDSDNTVRYLYADDYATFKFMAAKCYQFLDELEEAGRYVAEAKEIRPDLAGLLDYGMEPETNVIVVIEAGRAPRKRQEGPRGAILGYSPEPGVSLTMVSLDGRELSFAQTDDLYSQATTLGGRSVDDLNRTKAERQDAIQAAGFATTVTGYALLAAGSAAHDRQTREALQAAGLIAMLVGIITMVFAEAAIDPGADTRAWTLLPGQIFLAFGRVPEGGGHRLSIRARGDPGGDPSQEWREVPVEKVMNLYAIRLLPGRAGGVWNPASPGETP
jgi:hypothetical protein